MVQHKTDTTGKQQGARRGRKEAPENLSHDGYGKLTRAELQAIWVYPAPNSKRSGV